MIFNQVYSPTSEPQKATVQLGSMVLNRTVVVRPTAQVNHLFVPVIAETMRHAFLGATRSLDFNGLAARGESRG